MDEPRRLLELIETYVVGHGGDLGGWTRLDDGALQLFDGRATLRAELVATGRSGPVDMVHVHVFTKLHEYDDEELEACLVGIGEDVDAALRQAAVVWTTSVAGPIKSLLDDKPICMTRRAGDDEVDFGLPPGLRAFVGPVIRRGHDDPEEDPAVDDAKPWFRFAAESAAPRRVHLAKATVSAPPEEEGWRRELEIDGHDVSHVDPDWPADEPNLGFGYATRFAVFEFPNDSPEIRRRAELERTIRHFAENFAKHGSIDGLMREMIEQGFDPDLVHETESFATSAFGRWFFERFGVRYSAVVIRARGDGRVETGVPLMSIPAYSRARALAPRLSETMSDDDFRSLCLYHAESNAIIKAVQATDAGAMPDFAAMEMHPCVVPDRDVDARTMEAALAEQHALVHRGRRNRNSPTTKKKPWWKFW